MKNLTMALALAGAIVSHGAELSKNSPKEAFESAAEEILKAETQAQFQVLNKEYGFATAWVYYNGTRNDIAALYDDVDKTLGSRGIRINGTLIKSFPRMSANSRAFFGIDTNTPLYRIAMKYNCDARAFQLQEVASADEFGEILDDLLNNSNKISLVNEYKQMLRESEIEYDEQKIFKQVE